MAPSHDEKFTRLQQVSHLQRQLLDLEEKNQLLERELGEYQKRIRVLEAIQDGGGASTPNTPASGFLPQIVYS